MSSVILPNWAEEVNTASSMPPEEPAYVPLRPVHYRALRLAQNMGKDLEGRWVGKNPCAVSIYASEASGFIHLTKLDGSRAYLSIERAQVQIPVSLAAELQDLQARLEAAS